MIHCGSVSADDRRELRDVAKRICKNTRVEIVAVP